MSKLRKVLLALLIMALAIGLNTPAFAQSRHSTRTSRPIESVGICTDQSGNTMDYGVWVYGLTIYADEASSFMGVYDCDTTTELNSATIYPKDEVGEPTQYKRTSVWYDIPMYYSDGVGVIIFTGVGFVHYGPEPTG